jgi:chemotaxis response regulator CheB
MSTTLLVGAHDFPVICLGGSAGGLDAYIRLLSHLPSDLGVAVVIVNHLRKTATLLHEVLPQYTTMPVEFHRRAGHPSEPRLHHPASTRSARLSRAIPSQTDL